jgi:hypothetical protein
VEKILIEKNILFRKDRSPLDLSPLKKKAFKLDLVIEKN